MSGAGEKIVARRSRRAWIVSGALIAALLCLLWINQEIEEAPDAVAGTKDAIDYTGRIWKKMKDGKSLEEAESEMGFIKVEKEKLPNWFEQEVVEIDELGNAIANKDWSLMRFSIEGDAEEVSTRLIKRLKEKGWSECDSEYDYVLTCTKRKGKCSWLMLECSQIEGDVVGVLHIKHD